MGYPNGAIKTVEELFEAEHKGVHIIYYSSAEYGMEELNILSIKLSQMIDGNIGRLNGYNDWFMFVDKEQAQAYAKNA